MHTTFDTTWQQMTTTFVKGLEQTYELCAESYGTFADKGVAKWRQAFDEGVATHEAIRGFAERLVTQGMTLGKELWAPVTKAS